MTNVSLSDAAVLLAALEVLPGEPRDLAELVELSVGMSKIAHELDGVGERESDLLTFIRQTVDFGRVELWRGRLDKLAANMPSAYMAIVTDSAYPRNLLSCFDRPPFVFVDGEVLDSDSKAVSIVGSRLASARSIDFAADLAAVASTAGFTIVSGLARGTDGAAHEAALNAGGRTIAVIATGIDSAIYPPEHDQLASRIRRQGALVSQFRPGDPPTRTSFVKRNAIISGLARVSVVVEATERSGTRTEIESALKQDRKVILWEPTMASEEWAKQYLSLDNVTMARTVGEIMTSLEMAELDPA